MLIYCKRMKKPALYVIAAKDESCLARHGDLTVPALIQLIQTVTAVDPDEPLGGQHFYYSLAPDAANNPNFTLRDNQGRAGRPVGPLAPRQHRPG